MCGLRGGTGGLLSRGKKFGAPPRRAVGCGSLVWEKGGGKGGCRGEWVEYHEKRGLGGKKPGPRLTVRQERVGIKQD